MKNTKYDAIIVGTGIGGGTIGFSLAKKGLKVLFIEKGNNSLSKKSIKGNYAETFDKFSEHKKNILNNSGRAFEKIIEGSELKYPFIGSGTGGSSAIYGMAMERFFPSDFVKRDLINDQKLSNFPSEGWPFNYEDIIEYYIRSEKLYSVKGDIDNLKADYQFGYQDPPEIKHSNNKVFKYLQRKGLNPYILPRASKFSKDCLECQGFLCPKDCKIDSFNACVIPAIEKYGAEIITNSEVVNLISKGDLIKNISILKNNKIIDISSEIYILAAGAIYTPYLLLKSSNEVYPKGLSNQSGQVGKNLMRHLIDIYIVNTNKKIENKGFIKEIAFNDLYNNKYGRLGTVQSFGRPPDNIIMSDTIVEKLSNFTNLHKSNFRILRPIITKLISRYFSKKILFNTILEDLPYMDNQIEIDQKTNLPILNYRLFPYEKRLLEESRKQVKKIFNNLGVRLIKQAEDNKRLAHVCGTCRSGNDPKYSVVDKNCKSHEIKNLYISDSSIFPTSGGTNPGLTIAANALRISDQIT